MPHLSGVAPLCDRPNVEMTDSCHGRNGPSRSWAHDPTNQRAAEQEKRRPPANPLVMGATPLRRTSGLLIRFLGTAVTTTALMALVGPPTISSAESVQRETLRVAPDGGTVRTTNDLRPGSEYLVEVEGTFQHGAREADAECSTSPIEPIHHRDRSGLELLVDGADVDWTAEDPDVFDCDRGHRYSIRVAVSSPRPLAFRIDVPPSTRGQGSLLVSVTGPGAAPQPVAATPEQASPSPAPARSTSPEPAPAAQAPAAERSSSNPSSSSTPGSSSSTPATTGQDDDGQDAAGDDAPGRQLTTAELLAILGPDASLRGAAATLDDQHTVELAVAPGGASPVDAAAGPTSITWLAVFGLLATVTLLLMPPSVRWRIAGRVGAELRSVSSGVLGSRSPTAVAHRSTTDARPSRSGRRPGRRGTGSALAHRSG